MRVLTFSTLFPNCQQPNHGVFVKHRMAAVRRYCNVDLRVVAPIPFFPKLPFPTNKRWEQFAKVPARELVDEIEVYHPRYLVTPKLGMSLYGSSMFLGALREVSRINRDFPFDVLDAHYIYPDGLAAVLLGQALRKPVVLSARGTDINFYPSLPLIKPMIKGTLAKAAHIISVCQSLRDLMVDVGTAAEKISVIPNGVDPSVFRPLDAADARYRLRLPPGEKIVVSVGALIARKGMGLLVDAVAELHRNGRLNFRTYVIGEGEERERLCQAVKDQGLQDHVTFVGEVNNSDLPFWFSAADLSFLGSSREGWPNVVSESLACGTPVVATPANGIPEIICSQEYGLIVERNAQSFAEAILAALRRDWDREKIISYGQSRPWSLVAEEVYHVFERALHASYSTIPALKSGQL